MLNESNLHNYQRACIEHIIRNKNCGLFLDMGLGKTVSTLTAFNDLKFDYCEILNALVIAPKRVTETVWQEESEKWTHLKHLRFSKIIGSESQRIAALHAKADIYLISRDNIAWLCAYFGGHLPYDMLIIDELSSFKSYNSKRFKSLRLARQHVNIKRVVGLTGTPAPNSFIDLWAQIWLLDMGERLGKNITSYRNRWFKPGRTNGQIVFNYVLLNGAEQEIMHRISDICISMQSADYLTMPVRTDNYIQLRLPDKIQKAYDDFERSQVLQLGEEEVGALSAAALSNKLLQFANGSIYDENHFAHSIHEVKLDAAKEIIENANGQPVLIAWTYQFDRDRLMDALKSYSPRELKTAKDINDWNAGSIQVMLAHPASAGHGLNLQAGGSIILWYGLTWSLELYQQFNARLYRQGQDRHVIINHLVMQKTHDEDVVKALRNKDLKQNALLLSIKAKIEKYKNLQ